MVKLNNNIIETCHEYGLILDSREIFLHGINSEDSEVNYKMAMNFLKNLKILERNSNPIIIHSQNIGGEWWSGMTIFDAIKQSPCKFVFICYGVAASMGSIIPQAVFNKGYRISMPQADWLIHEGDLSLEGIHTQVKSNLEYMNLNRDTMYEIYTDSCVNGSFFNNYNRSKVKAYLKRKIREKTDWCLSGKEAVEYGFADAILGDPGYETIDIIKADL